MKNKKSWVLYFIIERIINLILFPISYIACLIIFVLLLWGLTSVFESVGNAFNAIENFFDSIGVDPGLYLLVLPLIVNIIGWCLVYRGIRVHKRAMTASEFYRRPLIKCKGVITEVHLENESFLGSTFFRPQWVSFETEDGRQIKAYRPMERIGLLRINFPDYSGSKGWLYYRQGKKFDNFEKFVNEDPLVENPFPGTPAL